MWIHLVTKKEKAVHKLTLKMKVPRGRERFKHCPMACRSSLNFRHEKIDNKMYCVVCIMFGIVNRLKYIFGLTNSLEVREHQGMFTFFIKVCIHMFPVDIWIVSHQK